MFIISIENLFFEMSRTFCTNCGQTNLAEDKFCSFCGQKLENIDLKKAEPTIPLQRIIEIPKYKTITESTFFCPKCNIENSIKNDRCISCNEDFSKYSFKRSISKPTQYQPLSFSYSTQVIPPKPVSDSSSFCGGFLKIIGIIFLIFLAIALIFFLAIIF